MKAYRCDQCGKFTKVLHDVYGSTWWSGPLRQVCAKCLEKS